jgi:hypothetical protein
MAQVVAQHEEELARRHNARAAELRAELGVLEDKVALFDHADRKSFEAMDRAIAEVQDSIDGLRAKREQARIAREQDRRRLFVDRMDEIRKLLRGPGPFDGGRWLPPKQGEDKPATEAAAV